MAGSVRSKTIECLKAFMQLRSSGSDAQIDSWVRSLAPLRSKGSRAPLRERQGHSFVLADAERIEVPDELRATSSRRLIDPAPIPFPEHAAAAADLPPSEVYKRIVHLIGYVTEEIQGGETPYFDVPDLHGNNAIYDARGNVFLGRRVRRISLHDTTAFMQIVLTLELALEMLQRGMRMTKRHVYYHHQTKIPEKRRTQIDSDKAIAALSNILEVRRGALGFMAVRRGSVYGSLVIRDRDQTFDLSKVSIGGWGIPGFLDDVEIVDAKAAFILLVEKEVVAAHLAQARWYDVHPSIMVCSGGFPSFGARELTRRLAETLRVPVYALTDGDPWGVRVALTHAHGAISTAMETPWLACKDVRWAGLYPSDYERFGLSSQVEISLTAEDVEAATLMLNHPSTAYVNGDVRRELGAMLEHDFKTELDSLLLKGSEFLVREYLPRKLFDTDLVKL